ncbi:MAG TPA: HAD family hydrolase [Candidatus Limnocylindria bacterium]|nr:HAD family hydrolase [Candidatus Limnocylindria bacterium]
MALFQKNSGGKVQNLPIHFSSAVPFNGALPIKLISTDFDGTLHAEHEDPPVPHELQELIASLQVRGAKWVINTGRDLGSLMETLGRARLRIKPDYVVVVEREIYCHEEARFVEHAEWNNKCQTVHAELFAIVRRSLTRLVDWVRVRNRATVYSDAYSPFCIIAETNAEMDAIQQMMEAYCTEVPGLTVVRNDVYSRFSHIDFNKGTALAELGRMLGVTAEETFAAGDHYNDVPMLSGRYAKFIVCPDNAIPPVKELVRQQKGYVSHQPWGHGVARGLEHYLGVTTSGR